MSDEQQDESLGLEQLPQTELDAVPGKGEKQDPNTEDTHEAGMSKPDITTPDAAKPMAEQNRDINSKN
jgi:hypothetical protein